LGKEKSARGLFRQGKAKLGRGTAEVGEVGEQETELIFGG